MIEFLFTFLLEGLGPSICPMLLSYENLLRLSSTEIVFRIESSYLALYCSEDRGFAFDCFFCRFATTALVTSLFLSIGDLGGSSKGEFSSKIFLF
jgi:hypothetical protein